MVVRQWMIFVGIIVTATVINIPTAMAFRVGTTTTTTTRSMSRNAKFQLPMAPLDPVVELVNNNNGVVVGDPDNFVPDTNGIIRSSLIALTLGGGLIPGLISANKAMMTSLSGRKGYDDDSSSKDKETYENYDPNNTFDPTMGDPNNVKLREYVMNSNAAGPVLPKSQFLFSADPIPLVDIIAVLGRIDGVNSIVDWKNLPSTKRNGGEFSSSTGPPMWLPRKAFKVLIRKSKNFKGWPVDSKTGLPIGGEELKSLEEKRISKPNALIGDAALDAVFDSWSWGASIATPDKVEQTLKMIKRNNNNGSKNEIDLDAFVNAAIRGRSNTAIGAALFIVIQLIVFFAIFLSPLVEALTGIDLLHR